MEEMAGWGGGLTVFAAVDLQALVLPDDEGWRRADHVADDDGVVAFVELLWTGRVLEGDLLCGWGTTTTTTPDVTHSETA